jgi:cytoskeletal protein RodZ
MTEDKKPVGRIGEILKQERERRQISIEDVARKLRLNAKYIEALEADKYDQLPGDTYIRVYLRSLSSYFSLNAEEILGRFFDERGVTGADTLRKDSSTKINLAAQQEEKPNTPVIMTLAAIALLAVFSFIVNRQGCFSSSADKRPRTAVNSAAAGQQAHQAVLKDTNKTAVETQAQLPTIKSADSQKVPVADTVRSQTKLKPVLTDTLQKTKKAEIKKDETKTATLLLRDTVKPVQAPVKQTLNSNAVTSRQPKDTVRNSKPASVLTAKDTAKPVKMVVKTVKDTVKKVSDTAKKATTLAPTAQTGGNAMVLRMTVAGDSCWGRVFSDGANDWRNIVLKGKGVTFTARDSFNVHVGVCEAVTFTLNGKPLQLPPDSKGVMTFKVDRSGAVTLWPLEKWKSVFEGRF